MTQDQEFNLIRSVAKLEEVAKMQRVSNHGMHDKLDKLIDTVSKNNDEFEAAKIRFNNEVTPLKRNTFIVIGANKFLLVLFFAIYMFAFWRQIEAVLNKQFEAAGLKTESPHFIRTRGGDIIKLDSNETDTARINP